jgi:hypothetical protein
MPVVRYDLLQTVWKAANDSATIRVWRQVWGKFDDEIFDAMWFWVECQVFDMIHKRNRR